MARVTNYKQPRQDLPDSRKGKQWGKDNIDYWVNSLYNEQDGNRKSFAQMEENLNLANGVIDSKELEKIYDPLGLSNKSLNVPYKEDVINIIEPSLKTLAGEEIRRGFDYKIAVINPEAISEKEEELTTILKEKIDYIIQNIDNKEEINEHIDKLKKWSQYDAQSVRERAGSHLASYYYKYLELDDIFNEGFDLANKIGEQTYRIEPCDNDVKVELIDPLTLYVDKAKDERRIEKSNAIVVEDYLMPTDIIAQYDLTDNEKNRLYSGSTESNLKSPNMVSSEEADPQWIHVDDDTGEVISNGKFITKKATGEWRVLSAYWKSLRGVVYLTYPDEETGDEITEVVDVGYEPDIEKGETVSDRFYIEEWWKGTLIGLDIYKDIKPCEVQFRDINNVKQAYPPFRGYIFADKSVKVRSLVDMLKPIQAQWTTYQKKMEMIWAKNWGKIVRIDYNKKPAGMSESTFYNWIVSFGIVVEDNAKEDMKGKPAGAFQSSVQSTDVELSGSINSALNMLVFIRDLADDISGISRQRRGDVMASDAVRNTQEAIVRSTNQTEKVFYKHTKLKEKVLSAVIETAKYTVDTGNKKVNYITDELTTKLLEIDVDKFVDTSYGVFVMNSSKIFEIDDDIKRYSDFALQSGQVALDDLISISMMDSISSKVVTLKLATEEKRKRDEQQREADRQNALQVEQLKQQAVDKQLQAEITIEQLKLQVEIQKIKNAQYLKELELDTNDKENKEKVELEKEKLRLEEELTKLEQRLKYKDSNEQRSFDARENDKDRKAKINTNNN